MRLVRNKTGPLGEEKQPRTLLKQKDEVGYELGVDIL